MAANCAESRGWQVGKSLIECISLLYHNQQMCDVTFNIAQADGTTRKLGAHKLILSARSPVFEVMLSGKFLEQHEVNIVDSEVEPFSEMLRYIYGEEVNLTSENVLEILNLAQKYIIEGLMKQCTEYMKDKVTPDTVCDILTHSVYFNDDKITNDCLRLAWSKMKEVCQTPGFLTMSQVALKCLLTANDGHTDGFTEADLLTAVLKWADSQCNADKTKDIREHLGDCLYSIRFANLTSEEFATMLGRTSILTHIEMSEWFCFLANQHDEHKQRLDNWGFDTSARGLVIMRDHPSRVPNGGNNTSIKEEFSMTTNKKVTLDQFSVYGGSLGTVSDIAIIVTNCATGVCSTYKAQITSDGTDKLYPLPLGKPITLEPNIKYKVTVTATNAEYICDIGTQYNFTVNGINIVLQPTQWAGGMGYHGIVAAATIH